jgi:ActD protein
MYLIGEFREKAETVAAIRSLRAGGIDSGDLDLFSEEPVGLPRGVLDRPSSMSLVSVAGAITFGSLATGFIYFTQHNYKLVTGGMPLFSFWATGVITYEMTMLGAIVAAFLWFLRESGLLRKRDRSAPVPVVDPGSMCLRVRCRSEQAQRASEALQGAGAIHIERRGEA